MRKLPLTVIVLLIPVLILAYPALKREYSCRDFQKKTPFRSDVKLRIHDRTVDAELTDTSEKRVQGLSNRSCMRDSQAMIFSFDTSSKYCFWMKDMHFPIDIVWLDSSKYVTNIQKNISPDTYPKQFCPDKESQHALELTAGSIERLGITQDMHIPF